MNNKYLDQDDDDRRENIEDIHEDPQNICRTNSRSVIGENQEYISSEDFAECPMSIVRH